MANHINTIKDVGSFIAKTAATMFVDKGQYIKSIDKEPSINGQAGGYNVGDTININIPARLQSGTGADISSTTRDIVEEKVSLTLDTQRHVAVALTSAEIATDMAMKSWAKRVLDPAVNNLVQETESDILEKAVRKTYNHVGVAGSTAFNTDDVLSAGEKMHNYLCPMDDKAVALLYPGAMRKAVNARNGLFQSASEIAKQYKSGAMGIADGFTFLRNNLLPTHTNGSDVAGIAINDSSIASGISTLHIDGLTAGTGTISKGSVFSIPGVNAVHPITKKDLGFLQQFVVREDIIADGSGEADVIFSPSIYDSTSGSLQNVSVLPNDSDGLSFIGSSLAGYRQALTYHPSAARFASAPLVKPDGVDLVGQETVDGITIRVIRDYDVTSDQMIMRLDILYGYAVVRPEWQCRITE